MAESARTTDTCVGVCTGHPPVPSIPMVGTITTSSTSVSAGGLGCARMGDIVVGACGHIGVIVSYSGTVSANGMGMARKFGTFVGQFSGIIVGGEGTVDIGG